MGLVVSESVVFTEGGRFQIMPLTFLITCVGHITRWKNTDSHLQVMSFDDGRNLLINFYFVELLMETVDL